MAEAYAEEKGRENIKSELIRTGHKDIANMIK